LEEKKNERLVCPSCVRPIQESVCKLVGPEHRSECLRRFLEQSPEDFIKWLKEMNVSTEAFLKALEEAVSPKNSPKEEGEGQSISPEKE